MTRLEDSNPMKTAIIHVVNGCQINYKSIFHSVLGNVRRCQRIFREISIVIVLKSIKMKTREVQAFVLLALDRKLFGLWVFARVNIVYLRQTVPVILQTMKEQLIKSTNSTMPNVTLSSLEIVRTSFEKNDNYQTNSVVL